jgi:Protein of unknown function (DUF3098)
MKNASSNSSVETKENDKSALPFGKSNYTMMIVGLVILFAGFFIMTLDKEEFGFGFLGITLGPALAFIGFLFQFYPIFKKK